MEQLSNSNLEVNLTPELTAKILAEMRGKYHSDPRNVGDKFRDAITRHASYTSPQSLLFDRNGSLLWCLGSNGEEKDQNGEFYQKNLPNTPEGKAETAVEFWKYQEKHDGFPLITLRNGRGTMEMCTFSGKIHGEHFERWWFLNVESQNHGTENGQYFARINRRIGNGLLIEPIIKVPGPEEFLERYIEAVKRYITRDDMETWAKKATHPEWANWPLTELVKIDAPETFYAAVNYLSGITDVFSEARIKGGIETQFIRGAIGNQAAASAWEAWKED